MSTLRDFEDVDPIAVREVEPVRSPIGGEILGFTGPSNRETHPIVCREYRWPKENGEQNYYRKLGGYTFNEIDIERMSEKNIGRVLIQEIDNDRVLEFALQQFIDGEDGGFVNGRQKRGVPVSMAYHTWTAEEAAIIPASKR